MTPSKTSSMRPELEDKYPFWVNRVGALIWIAEGFVQLFTPWMPAWSLRFYHWWLCRENGISSGRYIG